MKLEYYVNKIKFMLTGGIIEMELSDDDMAKAIELALEEMRRYYSVTGLVLVKASKCIDLKQVEKDNKIKMKVITSIHRDKSAGSDSNVTSRDPMYVAYWNTYNNMGVNAQSRWIYNYMAYNTLQLIGNTVSTDLDFREDPVGRKLYINFTYNDVDSLALEYIPKVESVEDINGDYWVDILSQLSIAYAKIVLGRIRTRYTQTNALWTQDGEKLLQEGNDELKALRERLQAQANFMYPLD